MEKIQQQNCFFDLFSAIMPQSSTSTSQPKKIETTLKTQHPTNKTTQSKKSQSLKKITVYNAIKNKNTFGSLEEASHPPHQPNLNKINQI
jgi:hypothetical protein